MVGFVGSGGVCGFELFAVSCGCERGGIVIRQ